MDFSTMDLHRFEGSIYLLRPLGKGLICLGVYMAHKYVIYVKSYRLLFLSDHLIAHTGVICVKFEAFLLQVGLELSVP